MSGQLISDGGLPPWQESSRNLPYNDFLPTQLERFSTTTKPLGKQLRVYGQAPSFSFGLIIIARTGWPASGARAI